MSRLQLEDELERTGAIIRATEEWSSQYGQDIATHARLIRREAALEKQVRGYLRGVAKDVNSYINWFNYSVQVKADYNLEVVVNDDKLDEYDQEFITVVFDTVLELTAIGAEAGEAIYKVPLGISSQDAIIQRLTTEHVASLVGKKVNKDGTIVDNPNAEININETTRNNIVQSIKTSLALGETVEEATQRLQKVIANPKRATLIAQTESVNAYQSGLLEFARQSGAKGKEWQDVGAVDVCAEYSHMGPVPLDFAFDGLYLQKPTAHGRCRCGLRIIYAEEWDNLNK